MSHGSDGIDEGRLDLVPMIDTVMLLLLFFMLTTKFVPDEKVISSLLPTDKGQMATKVKVDEPKQVNIVIYPLGLEKGYQPSEYRDQMARRYKPGEIIQDAALRIGNAEPIPITGRELEVRNSDKLNQIINGIGKYVSDRMETYETGGGERKDQVPVIIHCYSGMPWRFAILAYDAVRAFEAQKQPNFKFSGNPDQLLLMREVTFAPPRIRNYSANELGNELYEIIHQK